MGSFIPTTARFVSEPFYTFPFVDDGGNERTGFCMLEGELQKIATALGSAFSVVQMNFNGKKISRDNVYIKDNASVCDGDKMLPVLSWSGNPDLRIYFFGYMNRGFAYYVYDITDTESSDPLIIGSFMDPSNRNVEDIDAYSISSNVYALNISSPSGCGSIIFYNGYLISTGYKTPNSTYDHVDGWQIISPDNTVYSARSIAGDINDAAAYGFMRPTSGIFGFEKLFDVDYPDESFDGLYNVIRGNKNTTQVITQGGKSYLLLGGRNVDGGNAVRATMVISSDLID